jgi:DNA-directed RNA polymerase specialized sigma24 family protein
MDNVPDLTDDQWAELLERLTHRALKKYRRQGWRRGDNRRNEWGAPDGTSPEDVALEAISLVIDGQRKYDPLKQPDFTEFMRSVVDSLVYHMGNKARRRKTARTPIRRDAETGEMVEVEFQGNEPDPLDECLATDVMEQVREMVMAEAADDPLVLRLFECLEAGITKRAEVAEYLEVDVGEVDKAQKRFRRKLDRRFSAEKERQR